MTADTESMTDPSYRGQITTPMIGNYGGPKNSTRVTSTDVRVVLVSHRVQPTAVVISDLTEKVSHHTAVEASAELENDGSDPTARSLIYISLFLYARDEASVGTYTVVILKMSRVLS